MNYYANNVYFDEIKSGAEILAEVRKDVAEAYGIENCQYTEETVLAHFQETLKDNWVLIPARLAQFCETDCKFVGEAIKLVISKHMSALKAHVEMKLA